MTQRIKFHLAIQNPKEYAWSTTENQFPCKASKGKKAIILNPQYSVLENGGHKYVIHVVTNMACPRGERQFTLDQIEFNRPKHYEA